MSMMRACEVCGAEFAGREATGVGRSRGGRPARFCSPACRQRAFRRRVAGQPGQPAGAPATPAAGPASGGVPRPLDGFVGRGPELTRLRSLLRSARLVTLAGPGGVGKTRLAQEFVGGVRDGGVWLIELDSVSRADLLPQVVATALGVGERAGRPLADAIVDALGDRRVLVVLDNCEHLIEASAELADALLRRCPQLRILATSRESLRVPGEVVFRVGALSLSAADAPSNRAALLRSDAVRLFTERAQACDPSFELTADNGQLVAEICRHVDGLPLAIELAARRVGALGLGQILDGLDDQLAILTEGVRTGPARHQELGAAIEWSYRLLTPVEQAVFRRLSVLAGGFDLDGAVAVCDGPDVDRGAVLRLVCALEAKSLVVRLVADGGGARFRQLNPIRAFGLDRLTAAGELPATRERAADWLAVLATPVVDLPFQDNVAAWRLRTEQENLVAAVALTSLRPDERYALLAVALARLWTSQDQVTSARALLARVLESARTSEALAAAAQLASAQGEHEEAVRLAAEAIETERRRDRPLALAKALNAMAKARLARGELGAAVQAGRELVVVLRPLGRPLDIAWSQQNLAWGLLHAGEIAEAEQLLAASLPVLRALATPSYLPTVLHTAGTIHLANCDVDAAEALFVEALRGAAAESSRNLNAVEGLAIVAAERRQSERAVRIAAGAAAMRRRLKFEPGGLWQRRLDTAIARARGELGTARADAAVAAGEQLEGDRLLAYALARGDVADRQPDAGAEPGAAVRLLTSRERQVAALVAGGMTNPEIAGRLAVSTRTVTAHLASIRTKLGVQARTQIALWFSQQASSRT
jgi:non-specific serine/threonine protein kinase